MSSEFIIEKDRLILKKENTDWRREATPEEFTAFQCGIKKGRELVALQIKKKIMELTVECYPEPPLSHK